MDVPHTTHLARTGKSGAQGSFSRLCPEHCRFCVSSGCGLDHKDTARRSYRPVHEFTKPHNSALLSSESSLSSSICQHKRNVLLLRNVAWYSLPVVSACNLLNQIYILTANLKFPPGRHEIQVTRIKLPEFISNCKILNAYQMAVSLALFPCIYTVLICLPFYLQHEVPLHHSSRLSVIRTQYNCRRKLFRVSPVVKALFQTSWEVFEQHDNF
jgi:hypothetical protein